MLAELREIVVSLGSDEVKKIQKKIETLESDTKKQELRLSVLKNIKSKIDIADKN